MICLTWDALGGFLRVHQFHTLCWGILGSNCYINKWFRMINARYVLRLKEVLYFLSQIWCEIIPDSQLTYDFVFSLNNNHHSTTSWTYHCFIVTWVDLTELNCQLTENVCIQCDTAVQNQNASAIFSLVSCNNVPIADGQDSYCRPIDWCYVLIAVGFILYPKLNHPCLIIGASSEGSYCSPHASDKV